MPKVWRAMILVGVLLTGCQPTQQQAITIAINPWPGYEFLYLAKQQGFFEDVGLDIELVQVASLSDAQRAYLGNRVDGFTSTLIEAVQVEALGGKPVKVVLAADYSNGGDVIIAGESFTDLSSLKDQVIGCEVGSLGLFVLSRALASHGMTLDDIQVQHVEQGDGPASMEKGDIQAMVTYPPYVMEYLHPDKAQQQIFSSSEIPWEVLDTLSISSEVVNAHPGLINKIRQAWQLALDYHQAHPQQAVAIMAQREGISPAEFNDALAGVHMLSAAEQQNLFGNKGDKILRTAAKVCRTLTAIDALETDCSHLPAMFVLPE